MYDVYKTACDHVWVCLRCQIIFNFKIFCIGSPYLKHLYSRAAIPNLKNLFAYYGFQTSCLICRKCYCFQLSDLIQVLLRPVPERRPSVEQLLSCSTLEKEVNNLFVRSQLFQFQCFVVCENEGVFEVKIQWLFSWKTAVMLYSLKWSLLNQSLLTSDVDPDCCIRIRIQAGSSSIKSPNFQHIF